MSRSAADDNRTRAQRPSGLLDRPDRVALWAVALAVVAMIAGAASARAGSSGGIGGGATTTSGGAAGSEAAAPGSGTATPGCPSKQFGRRTLKVGDCGDDVATLNWILKSKDYDEAPLADRFQTPTASAVRAFQQNASLNASGIVDKATSAAMVNSMPSQLATWYGPGFFGNQTACGQTLSRSTVGVAHKTLPCGSKVVLRYNGRFLRTTVIDRGPFANGAKWDLTQAAAQALRFEYTDDVRVAKLAR